MNLNKKGFSTVLMGAVAASSLLLVACGGGGGGGSSASTVTYTGLTTAATIDATSAPAIADSVISTSSMDSSSVTSFVGVSSAAGDVSAVDNLRGIVDIVKGFAASAPGEETLAGAQVSGSETVQGCSGYAKFSASYDDYYTDLYGTPIIYGMSISFVNYVADISISGDGSECGTELFNGGMSVSVTYNGPIDTMPEMNGMTITLSDLSVTETASGLNQAFSGTLGMSLNTSTGDSTLTMTANFRDTDGLVYRAENYTVDADSNGNVTTVSGRLYDPAYGYVDLTTTTPFTYNTSCYGPNGNLLPDSGGLLIEGANGGYIEIDATGNDCYTYTLIWSSDGSATNSSIVNW